MAEKRGNWTKLSSKTVHQNPYYSITQDEVLKPDGSEGQYYVVESKGSVYVVALDEAQNVYLIGLHRYTTNKFSVEIPAGGMEDDDALTAAKRELEEETGLQAEEWNQLGVLQTANGMLSENSYVFLATKLTHTGKSQQLEEGISEVKKVPLKEALNMIKDGTITDTQSIAPLALAAMEVGLL